MTITRRNLALGLTAAVAGLAATRPAAAVDLMSLSDSVGVPTAVSVAPGGSFSITATLSAGRPYTGLTFFLENPGAVDGGSGPLAITARASLPTNTLEDPVTSNNSVASTADASTPAGPDNALNVRNDRDLGYSNSDVDFNDPAATFAVATLTLGVSGSATPGIYTVQTAGAILTDANFGRYAIPNSVAYLVTVTPEPGSAAVAGVAAAGGLLGRRRRPSR